MPGIGQRKQLFLMWLPIILIFAVMLLVLTSNKSLDKSREEDVLMNLIKSSGAELSSTYITGLVKVDGNMPGVGDSVEIASMVAEPLGLKGIVLKAENWQNAYACGSKIQGELSDGSPVTIVGQVMVLPQGEKISHVMVNVAGADYSKTGIYRKRVGKALKQCGEDFHVAVTLSGRINTVLGDMELTACAEDMMSSAGAAIQERTTKENLVSLTGYSARLPGYMRYAGKDINLNVALRRSTADHATSVYVASPIILTEY
ncbi:MAG: YwmB family TATA-box binding protein [Desulfotomaculaceae bacterium]|nr:YwmB family TATA-box binding protein [Desulfotomaculaceae bacterium]